MANSYDTFSGTVSLSVGVSASKNGPAAGISGPSSSSSFTSNAGKYTLGAGVGQANLAVTFYLPGPPNASPVQNTLAASGSATINLQAIMDVLFRSGMSFGPAGGGGLKAMVFELLNATQDSVYGTACSSISVSPGASNPFPMNLTGTSPALTVANGGRWEYCEPGSALTGDTTAGITVSNSANTIKITNNDATLAAAVRITLIGVSTN